MNGNGEIEMEEHVEKRRSIQSVDGGANGTYETDDDGEEEAPLVANGDGDSNGLRRRISIHDEKVGGLLPSFRDYMPLYLGAGIAISILVVGILFSPKEKEIYYNGRPASWYEETAKPAREWVFNESCDDVPSTSEQVDEFLAKVDSWTVAQRCLPGAKSCSCKNPLRPAKPDEEPWRTNWEKGFQFNLASIENETTEELRSTIALIGDSITERLRGTIFGEEQEKFRNMIDFYNKKIHGATVEDGDDEDSTAKGFALGISGDRIPQVLYRLQNGEMAETLQPNVWSILIGTNDYIHDSCSIDSIVAGNIKITREILKRRSNATVFITSLLPVQDKETWNDYAEINRKLACYANYTDRVEFVNASSSFIYDGEINESSMSLDGIHPNFKGCQRLWMDVRHLYLGLFKYVGR